MANIFNEIDKKKEKIIINENQQLSIFYSNFDRMIDQSCALFDFGVSEMRREIGDQKSAIAVFQALVQSGRVV